MSTQRNEGIQYGEPPIASPLTWESLIETPPFHDEWEKLTQLLPVNMTLVHHLGLRSYWETLYIPDQDTKQYWLLDHHFATYGHQLEESDYVEAFDQARDLCESSVRVVHVRYDLRGAVPETWQNAPFRFITGHSFHKIPQTELVKDYIEVDGKWWHKRDYAEIEFQRELQEQH